MKAIRRLFHLPLLGKELTEQGARKRTYWMRVIYASLLYVLLGANSRIATGTSEPMRMLGAGRELFENLVYLQLAGIFLFLPAMTCGRITQEKERDSLVLLMLTDLSPGQIVLQKYLAALVPMFTFLLLGLPFAAVAYSYGGFTARDLSVAALVLLLSCLQVGAISIWASSWCRTTVSAFLTTYFLGAAFYAIPPLLVGLAKYEFDIAGIPATVMMHACTHFPPMALDFARTSYPTAPGLLQLVLVLASTAILWLALATWHLPRRAFLPAASGMRRFFRWLDATAHRVNRIFGNIAWRGRSDSLPQHAPIAWRERRLHLLGKPEHAVRFGVAALLVLGVSAHYMTDYSGGQAYGLSLLAAIVGTALVLVLSASAANVFVTERVKQTLEVLLTTPVSAEEIVRQKARGLWPLTLVFGLPLLALFGHEAFMERALSPTHYRQHEYSTVLYMICATLTLGILLPLVVWLSLWIGLVQRNRLTAILAAMGAIVVWCGGPFLLFGGILDLGDREYSYLYLLSPLTLPGHNELGQIRDLDPNPWRVVLVNFAFYGAALALIRAHCLRNADRFLRR